jgi:hypothetical protein
MMNGGYGHDEGKFSGEWTQNGIIKLRETAIIYLLTCAIEQ